MTQHYRTFVIYDRGKWHDFHRWSAFGKGLMNGIHITGNNLSEVKARIDAEFKSMEEGK